MSEPVSYEEFCKKYKLDPKSPESKKEYQEYKEKLDFFQSMMNK